MRVLRRVAVSLGPLTLVAFFVAQGLVALADAHMRAGRARPPALARLQEPQGRTVDGGAILSGSLFGGHEAPAPSGRCDPGLRLVSSVITARADDSFAVLESGGRRSLLRVGDRVGGAELTRLGWAGALVRQDDGHECRLSLFARPAPPTSEPSEPRHVEAPALDPAIAAGIRRPAEDVTEIDREVIERLREDPRALLGALRAVPARRGDEMVGLRLVGSARSGLLQAVGLERGDVVEAIGGIPMTSPDAPLEAYARLRDVHRATVDLVRRGRRLSMTFEVR